MTNVTPAVPVRDLLGRPLKNLRLSVTDRCNLRCSYCMPEEEYRWLPNADILTFTVTNSRNGFSKKYGSPDLR